MSLDKISAMIKSMNDSKESIDSGSNNLFYLNPSPNDNDVHGKRPNVAINYKDGSAFEFEGSIDDVPVAGVIEHDKKGPYLSLIETESGKKVATARIYLKTNEMDLFLLNNPRPFVCRVSRRLGDEKILSSIAMQESSFGAEIRTRMRDLYWKQNSVFDVSMRY